MARKGRKGNTAGGKRGKYQKIDDEQIFAILDAIAGGSSARKACEKEGIAQSTFFTIVTSDKDFFEHYARARKAQAEYLFDTLGAIEDNTLAGKFDPQAAKVVIDSRKWRLAKLHPKEYGDKSQVDVVSSDGSIASKPATIISFAGMSPEERTDIARKLFTGK